LKLSRNVNIPLFDLRSREVKAHLATLFGKQPFRHNDSAMMNVSCGMRGGGGGDA
jgi:hypothetical protein